ncbi:unnamed protein product [Thelazia callipaeda]|uniref:Str_synth domain-containing protein n=1 Tax=Thelazia callipaeda TaxID=103827 RepID=A0A0N5CRH1_THECL|nr:unnamed protein product [Thelazia callipaeda]
MGTLKANEELTHAEILSIKGVDGPESLAFHRPTNSVFTGSRTGYIIKIHIDELNTTKVAQGFKLLKTKNIVSCDGSYHTFSVCGRPLGIRFHPQDANLMIVADAYHGIFGVQLETAQIKRILKPGTKVINDVSGNRPVLHFNDFDISRSGRYIVFTEPSNRFPDRDFLYAMMEHNPDGRLLWFDTQDKILRVIVDKLYYPNGVELDDTGRCVYFSEMGNLRILKHCFYYERYKFTVVASNLPGYPDNIRKSKSGMLWVPLGRTRLKDDSWITERPALRNFIASLYLPFTVDYLLDFILPKYGLLLLIDPKNGTIVRSFHDPNGSTIYSISHALELDDGSVVLGSDVNSYLVRFRPSKLP